MRLNVTSSSKRLPAWTDRIMYISHPDSPDTPQESAITNVLYTSIPSYTTSDHVRVNLSNLLAKSTLTVHFLHPETHRVRSVTTPKRTHLFFDTTRQASLELSAPTGPTRSAKTTHWSYPRSHCRILLVAPCLVRFWLRRCWFEQFHLQLWSS